MKIEDWDMTLKKGIRFKRTIRKPLDMVQVLAERLRKKDAPGRLYKSTKENVPFLIKISCLLWEKVWTLLETNIIIGNQKETKNKWLARIIRTKVSKKSLAEWNEIYIFQWRRSG